MRRRLTVVLAIVVLAIAAWWLGGGPQPVAGPAEAMRRPALAAPASPRPAAPQVSDASPAVERVAHKKVVDAAERERVLQGIRDALDRRERERERVGQQAEPDAARPRPGDATPGGTGGIRDRSDGELAVFMRTLNEDFLPLADECYAHALDTDPELRGMLDLHFVIIADEEIAGLVESMELGRENQIAHAGLLECLRETMLSTIFPAPEDSGRAEVRLTIPFEPPSPP